MSGARIQIVCAACSLTFVAFRSKRRRYCSRTCQAEGYRGVSLPDRHVNADPANFHARLRQEGECLVWTGHRNTRGYGHFSIACRLVLAHRHAWSLANGPIPAGMFVLHHCDNPPCCRLDHLYLGTKADNCHDMHRRGRAPDFRGERHPSAKLSATDVERIRDRIACGETRTSCARDFHVTVQAVSAIAAGRTWRATNAA